MKAVVAVAGAGTQSLAWLMGVAGASRTVLEAVVPYDSGSLVEFLGYKPAQLVSAEAAKGMARSAYRRAVHLRADEAPVVGIACTGAIASDRPKRGAHRCHVAAWDVSGLAEYSVEFVKGSRDRDDEEALASLLVLWALAEASRVDFGVAMHLRDEEPVKVRRTLYENPIEALIAEHVETVTVTTDGHMAVDRPLRGGVLAGSFNPLHRAHEELAEAASNILGQEVTFELSITNVDKPPLQEAEVRQRIAQIDGRPVVVTRAPVFYEKARLLPGCTFVIGWDTAVRLVDQVYYHGDTSEMLSALHEIRRLGCRFLVAGRAEGGVFHALADVPIPDGFQSIFSEIPESAFRCDLSSTELRLADRRDVA